MNLFLAVVFVSLVLVALWGIRQSRREQKRLLEEIGRKGRVIDMLNRLGR